MAEVQGWKWVACSDRNSTAFFQGDQIVPYQDFVEITISGVTFRLPFALALKMAVSISRGVGP